MDVNGAKVLQRRLDPARVLAAAPRAGSVSESALPVFQWFGVDRSADDALPVLAESGHAARMSSWLRRLSRR